MPNLAQTLFLLSFTTTLGTLIYFSRHLFSLFEFEVDDETIKNSNPLMAAYLQAPQLFALVIGALTSLAFAYFLRAKSCERVVCSSSMFVLTG